jgi:pyruvate dehydrogenase E1 component alpha subunit
MYVCENNLYTEYTHFSETTAGDILSRAAAFGLESASVNGQDVRAVNDVSQDLVERARRGGGPAFLLCNTYRYHGHHVGDINREYYRSKQEEQTWRERDPIIQHRAWIIEQHLADAETLDRLHSEVESEMKKAVQFAINAEYPNSNQVDQHVYA